MEERIVDRLRKVLALTSSPVEGEAQAAAAMLSKLLADHNLSIADLERKGHKAKPGVKETNHDLGKAAFTWKLDLAEAIAEHYLCVPIVDREEKTVVFVGRPDNVDSLKMLYAWIIEQIKRLSAEDRRRHQQETGEHIDPLRWQVHFGVGAVERLATRLHEKAVEDRRKQEREAPSDANSMALMIVDRQSEVSDFLEKQYGYRVDGQKTAKQRKDDEDWKKYLQELRDEEDRLERLKETDIEAYYLECPHERPEMVAAREAQYQKERKKEEARERRNRRKRTGPAYRPESPEAARRRIQGETANTAGYAAGTKVNLEPFIEDGGRKDKKRIGAKR